MNDKDDILEKIARAVEDFGTGSFHLKIESFEQFAGIKDGRVDVDWTGNEWDVRALSNSLDRMEKRSVLAIRMTTWADPEFVAGKRPEEDKP